MNVIQYIRQSLAARLSFWVVVCVAVLFVAALGIMFHYSRQAVKEEAMEKAMQTLQSTVLHIDNTLHKVEVASDNMKWLVEQHIETPDSMFSFSRKILENNPDLNGCSIAFEPYYYEEKGKYFSAYSYNGNDSIETEQEGSDEYEYHWMDWYLIPKLLEKPYWVEPFHEENKVGVYVDDILTSFCQPIHDKSGKMVGILSVDISLEWFSRTISQMKPFPNSYCIMLGKGGTYLVHPDTTKLFYETIFTPTLERPDSVRSALGEAMINGQKGYKVFHFDGKEDNYVFYTPFKNTGWSVAIVCPESDIFGQYNRLRVYLIAIIVVGLVLLLVFCLYIIRTNLHPLKMLAQSAQRISEGDYEATIPDSKRKDEIGHLQHSFSLMQMSLADYIHRIRHSTDTLTRRNSELVKANERAKEADHVKAAFIQNMTDQMKKPVGDIAQVTDLIMEQHQEFSDEKMKECVDKMLENTEMITHLLNKLLDASQNQKQSGSSLEK